MARSIEVSTMSVVTGFLHFTKKCEDISHFSSEISMFTFDLLITEQPADGLSFVGLFCQLCSDCSV